MKKHANEEDDSPPGGRALDRLHQFEMERGYEEADDDASSQQGDEARGEATGGSQQQGETGGAGGAASETDAARAEC
jgi:hypothetical protein